MYRDFPGVNIQGEVYPPTAYNAMLAQLLTYFFWIGLIVFFVGDPIFNLLGPLGGKLRGLRTDHPVLCFIVLMVSQQLAGQLLATGAFEVSVGGKQIFSKLQSGNVPSYETLSYLIQKNWPSRPSSPSPSVSSSPASSSSSSSPAATETHDQHVSGEGGGGGNAKAPPAASPIDSY